MLAHRPQHNWHIHYINLHLKTVDLILDPTYSKYQSVRYEHLQRSWKVNYQKYPNILKTSVFKMCLLPLSIETSEMHKSHNIPPSFLITIGLKNFSRKVA